MRVAVERVARELPEGRLIHVRRSQDRLVLVLPGARVVVVVGERAGVVAHVDGGVRRRRRVGGRRRDRVRADGARRCVDAGGRDRARCRRSSGDAVDRPGDSRTAEAGGGELLRARVGELGDLRRNREGARSRRDHGGGVAVRPEVARRIGCTDAVAVARRRAEPAVGEGRSGRRPDLGEDRAARALAALDPVAGHADVVGRRAPAQVDRRAAGSRRGQRSRRRGYLRVTRADGRRHVGLDLRRGQRDVVDPHLVDQPAEELPVDVVAADLQRVRRRRDRARLRRARDLRPVHEQPHRRAVVGHRQVRPRARRQLRRPEGLRIAAADDRAAGRLAGRGRGRFQVVVVVSLVDHVAPRARRPSPRFTHASSVILVVRCRSRSVRDRHEAFDPLKESALPNFPALVQVAPFTEPVLPLPDGIGDARPRALVEPVRGDEAADRRLRRRGGGVRRRGRGCRPRRSRGRDSCSSCPPSSPVSAKVDAGRRPDLGEDRAAGALAALHPVPGDARRCPSPRPSSGSRRLLPAAVAVSVPGADGSWPSPPCVVVASRCSP